MRYFIIITYEDWGSGRCGSIVLEPETLFTDYDLALKVAAEWDITSNELLEEVGSRVRYTHRVEELWLHRDDPEYKG